MRQGYAGKCPCLFYCPAKEHRNSKNRDNINPGEKVYTVTTVTMIASMGLTAAISMAATAILIMFLSTRELAGAGKSDVSMRVARFLTIGIVPLVMVFAVIVAVRIITVAV